MICNAGLGYGTVYVLESQPNECAGIKLASWAMFTLYCLTFLLQAMCLCGLEIRFCSNMGLISVMLYDMVVLAWA